ncbi:hypothetical protein ABVK25_007267 [Lepraria finkii]|uniref:Uncharacterized protein n=1 Tax=Lepraria finkii TaxID=1340010 RepID=A0ABR4B471_9LECA
MGGPASQKPIRLLCLYILIRLGFVQGQCYLPGGNLAIDHQPCDPHAFTSLCCQNGWTCLDNGLCIVTDPTTDFVNLSVGSSARGACTNPQWNSTACGSFCLNDPVNANDGTVISCGNQNWCCQPNAAAGTCDCGTGDGTFSLQAGIAQTVIGVTGLAFTSTDAVPIGSASASSSASSTSSQSASIIISPPTITGTPSSSTAALASSASSTDSVTPTGITRSTAFIAGIAATSAVVGAVIVAILFLLFQRRRRQRVMKGDYIPRSISTANTNTHPPTSEDLLQDPEDYNRPFPTHTASTTPEPCVNRSRHSLGIAPDHDQGPPEQTSLLYPPALDPYAPRSRDPNELQESYPMQEASGATAPPSYRSNPRGSLSPRGNAYSTMPRLPQPRRSDVAETGQDWFSDQPR